MGRFESFRGHMEATRQAYTPDSVTLTRREDGMWDTVALIRKGDVVSEVRMVLTDARFTLEAHWAPSHSYVYDLCTAAGDPPKVVAFEFAMHSFLQPVIHSDGSNRFLEHRFVEGVRDAGE